MQFTGKNLFQRIFFLIVAGILIVSLMLVTACTKTGDETDEGDDDDDTEQTETEWTPIANSDFTELYDTSTGTLYNPRVPKDWSFSGDYTDSSSDKAPDASGSDTRYGTVSVTDTNWAANQEKYQTEAIKDYNESREEDEKVSLPNPYTMYYEALKDKESFADDAYWELDEDGNLKLDDADIYNGIEADQDGKVTRDDDKVLMIAHLKYEDKDFVAGTASRYKSGSITIQPNAIVKITVRIRTMYFDPETGTFGRFPSIDANGNILTDGSDPNAVSLGATLSLTGGVEESMTITGIDTENEWRTFTFYIRGDASSSKTVNLELGLGSGDTYTRNYFTGGYVFFDNIDTEFLSMQEFDGGNILSTIDDSYEYELDGETPDNTLRARISRTYSDNSSANWASKNTAYYGFRFGEPRQLTISAEEVLTGGTGADTQLRTETKTTSSDSFSDSAVNDAANTAPFGSNTVIHGIYNQVKDTKLTSSMGYRFAFDEVLQENTYYRISIWLKTSDFKSVSGAGLYLVNSNLDSAYGSSQYISSLQDINTTTNELDEEALDEPENSYYKLNGWRQYSFYVKGGVLEQGMASSPTDRLSFEIWFGPVAGTSPDTAKYPDAYGDTRFVLFTEPTIETVTSSYYSSATAGENIATLDLSSTASTAVTNGGFTSLVSSVDPEEEGALEEISLPASWKQIRGLGKVNGDGEVRLNQAPADPASLSSGVLNKYNYDNSDIDLWSLGFSDAAALKAFMDADGTSDNSVLYLSANNTAFGYQSSSITIPANSIYWIQFRVYTRQANAFHVYLTDSDGELMTADLTAEVPVLDDDGEETGETETVTVNREENLEFEIAAADRWQTYQFYIRTGAESKTVYVELWAGSKFLANEDDDPETTYVTGAALFDDITYVGESKTEESSSITEDQKETNARLDKLLFDTPKENAEREENPELEAGLDGAKFYDYSKLDLKEDETEDDTSEDEEEEATTPTSSFGWVDIVTLVLALALIFALGAIAYKQIKSSKFVEKRKMKRAQKQAKNRSYDRKNAKPVVRRATGDPDSEDDSSAEEELPETEGSEFDEDLETSEMEAVRADEPEQAEILENPDQPSDGTDGADSDEDKQ